MAERKSKTQPAGGRDQEPREAKVITRTARQMMRLLEGQNVELVGRGAHQLDDGTFVAHIIATEEVLSRLPRNIGHIEIKPKRSVAAAETKVGTGNRYGKEGTLPHGVGRKE